MSSTSVAENYHLRWDSHLLNMNLSLANLFKNEKFADVMLLPSNSDTGTGILAHKLILTSCSSYFASIFDTNSAIGSTSGIVYIVLPPELSRHAIKILVQYMYSGEATVSNDILNEVLRGGELLKIRGLCRNSNNSNNNNNSNSSNSSSSTSSNNGNIVNNSLTSHHNRSYSSNSNKKSLDSGANLQINATKYTEQHQKQQDADLKSSLSSLSTTLPKESPVIVRSPKPFLPSSSLSSSQKIQPTISNIKIQNISVRKDVAIDPDEYHSSAKYRQQISSTFDKESQQSDCSETNCLNCISSPTPSMESLSTRESERIISNNEGVGSSYPRPQSENLIENHTSCNNKSMLSVYSRRASLPGNQKSLLKKTKNSSLLSVKCFENNSESKPSSIKQEPPDWSLDQRSNSPISKQMLSPLAMIKTESNHSGEEQNTDKEAEDDSTSYSPLTCEICSETFTLPKDWVHHIEGHMDSVSTHTLSKKKRKLPQPDSEFIATLKCDLCSTYYMTPAEWVRHIQNSHTETELAMSNVEQSSNTISKKSTTNTQKSTTPTVKKKKFERNEEYEMYLGKTCTVCNKKFSSYASMVIHSRTHMNKLL